MQNSIVISVNSVQERDSAVKKIYTSLIKQSKTKFIIQQDQVNRIKIFHTKGSMRILVTTYIVIILPVLLDLSPIQAITGTVDFHLDETIIRLETLARQLRQMNGKHSVQKKSGTKDLAQALLNIF